ncbi:hypothetical protein SMC26_14135 [Actinomadura fulvescens]|uniref:Arylsulfatase n=1 Tax=Actinomadura fulvescens TaxID=46160 RepID=A0ABN3Q4K9_9ACTN
MRPRIALISATPAAIGPAMAGLAEAFPEAEVWNLLDDKLLDDADAAGGLTERLCERMRGLIHHAVSGGADGILLTCSMYGAVTGTVETGIPVLAPDEAAFSAVAGGGYGHVLVVASLETALADSVSRLRRAAGPAVAVDGVVCPGAFEAAKRADRPALLDALLTTVRDSSSEAFLLAQYSLAPVADELAQALDRPVVSGPQAAAARLRTAIAGPALDVRDGRAR